MSGRTHIQAAGGFAVSVFVALAIVAPARADASATSEAIGRGLRGARLERLATVRIPRQTLADGHTLAPGTYVVVLDQGRADAADVHERWVVFEQRGRTRGRELASLMSTEEVRHASPRARAPQPGHVRIDVLKGHGYLRIWIARGNQNYLIHLPITARRIPAD